MMILRNMDTGLYSIAGLTPKELGKIAGGMAFSAGFHPEHKPVIDQIEKCLDEIETRIPGEPE